MKWNFWTLLIVVLLAIIVMNGCGGSKGSSGSSDVIFIRGGVDIRDYGAIANDGQDDTEAIQKAVDAASVKDGIVKVPAGVFHTVERVYLKKGISRLVGTSRNSVIKIHQDSLVWQSSVTIKNLPAANITIENIIFDGGKLDGVYGTAEEGKYNLGIDNSSDVKVINCTFRHNWYGNIIIFNQSSKITVEDNRFLDSDCGVITSGVPSNNLYIRRNYFDGAKMSEPISIYGSETASGLHKDIVITDNVIKNHISGSGILLRATDGALVKGNTIDNCDTGIVICHDMKNDGFGGVRNVEIKNNYIRNCIWQGILVQVTPSRGAEIPFVNSSITDNTIENTPFAFAIEKADDCDFINNQVIDSRAYFIILTKSEVSGNRFSIKTKTNYTQISTIGYKYKYYNDKEKEKIEGKCQNCTFKNNSVSPTSLTLFSLNSTVGSITNTIFNGNVGIIK